MSFCRLKGREWLELPSNRHPGQHRDTPPSSIGSPSSLSDLAFGGSLRPGSASGFVRFASDRLLRQRCALQNHPWANSPDVRLLIGIYFAAGRS